jgi:hydroxyethylthiazole kinase-like uncharacterized protein yjeF
MQRVLPAFRSLPLFGVERTREIERRTAAVLPAHTLMRRAGFVVARLAVAVAPHASRVWVAAGPGNNGGDGLEAAVHLQAAGRRVHVSLIGDSAHLPDDARASLARAQAAGVAIEAACPDDLGPGDIALDALLGIGASRAPGDAIAQAIGRLARLPCPVLAIDLPSGVHAGTGQPLGEACVRADHSLTLLTVKPGLFTAAGRDHAGTVWFDDLGVDTAGDAPDAWLSGADVVAPAARAHAQHKGSFGDVAVIGGAPGMTGAALLAARAALAAGAGRTYVSFLDANPASHDPARPELMVRAEWWKSPEATLRQSTVVCGCGGGDAVREVLPRLFAAAGRLVLDADALNGIASDVRLQTLLRARAAADRVSVLTPHPLEAARLLGSTAAQVQADRLGAAQAIADDFKCVVLLKGSGSVIAAPGTRPRVNSSGNAALATAGTGDVLAGWLGGLWAQRPDSADGDRALRVACEAAFSHGAAADRCGLAVLRADDLIEALAARR